MKEQALADAAMSIALRGANHYLSAHNLKPVSTEALFECCQDWCKLKLQEALHDAKEALACGMNQVAVSTFAASMMQAGIEAAKEASIAPEPSTH